MPQLSEIKPLTIEKSELAISRFMMYGEPLTQNGTEDFDQVPGYNPLIQGINYAFSGSGIWDSKLQGWRAINGAGISVVSLEETDDKGDPLPEGKTPIFEIVKEGLDKFMLNAVDNAYGQSYLKFGIESKAYPTSEYPDEKVKTFLMSYVVDPADDPTIISAVAGDGTEGQKYEITVDISDVDLPNKDDFMIFVDRDNYEHYIKIGEKMILADSIVHYKLPTVFTVNALPLDVVVDKSGKRVSSAKLPVQAVFEKLYPPGKGDLTYSAPVEATFTDAEHLPENVDFEIVSVPATCTTSESVTPVINLVSGTDADGDEILYKGTWTLQGEGRIVEGLTLPASETKKGQIWSFKAEAYTQPYGEPVMTGIVKEAPNTLEIIDAVPYFESEIDKLEFRADQKTYPIVMKLVDPDLADGTDTYTTESFTVVEGPVKGSVIGAVWNADTQEFSFTYGFENPEQAFASDKKSTLKVEVSYQGGQVASPEFPVIHDAPFKVYFDTVSSISADGKYDVSLIMSISERLSEDQSNHSYLHRVKTAVTLPPGFAAAAEKLELNYSAVTVSAFEPACKVSYDPSTRILNLDYTVEVRPGETLPLGNLQVPDGKTELLRIPLTFEWTPETAGEYAFQVAPGEVFFGESVDGNFSAVSAAPERYFMSASKMVIYGDFLMAGEPLTQNGTEDFDQVSGYDPKIQGINYAFSGSAVYDQNAQAWKSINGGDIQVHDLVETDVKGVPVPEGKRIFEIENKGVDNFMLNAVDNAYGQSYLKFTVASKMYPEAKRSFIMSYVVDPADDPTIISAVAGDGTEGQKYEITVDISDVDFPNKDGFSSFVDRDNYEHYIKIGEKMILADSIVHNKLPTVFTVNALPLDVVVDKSGKRVPSAKLPVQAVFEKLYPPGKGDLTYSAPVEATFTDAEHEPENVAFEIASMPATGITTDSVTPVINLLSGTDADGDEILFKGTWTLQGIEKTVEGLTLSASETAKGHVWIFSAEAYTSPYGEPVMTGVKKTSEFRVVDAPGKIVENPASLLLRGDRGVTSSSVTIRISDPDLFDGGDVCFADSFTVNQIENKGVISEQKYDAAKQEFSFTYTVANPDESIVSKDHHALVVEVHYGDTSFSTKKIPVTYVSRLLKPAERTSADLWKTQDGGTALTKGWNLLSVPIDLWDDEFDKNFTEFVKNLGSDEIWGWNSDRQVYEPLTALHAHEGFWIYLNAIPAQSFVMKGYAMSVRALTPGWHLMSVERAEKEGGKGIYYDPSSRVFVKQPVNSCPWIGVLKYIPAP